MKIGAKVLLLLGNAVLSVVLLVILLLYVDFFFLCIRVLIAMAVGAIIYGITRWTAQK